MTEPVSELQQAEDSRVDLLALALAKVAEAAQALVADWKNGGTQTPRPEPCGDETCGYASCALARALSKFEFDCRGQGGVMVESVGSAWKNDAMCKWAEGQPRRVQVLTELAYRFNELSDPMQSGNGGTEGLGGLSMPVTYSATVREFERLAKLMHAEAKSIHWHLAEYFLRCEFKNDSVWVKKKSKSGKTLSVQERRIVPIRDGSVRLEKVRRAIVWMADRWDTRRLGEPMLPSAVLDVAA